METQKHVIIYTDGACKGNPGIGGWGAILMYGQHTKELMGAVPNTTNNQMEMTAVIEALKALKSSCQVDLYTDSKYVQQGMQEWLAGWKRNDWKKADKKPVKNAHLWQMLDHQSSRHHIIWHWVKGHAGHPLNERADELANLAIEKLLPHQS